MNERPLESMVTHLVQCTCNGVINCPKGNGKALVQPTTIALRQPIIDLTTDQRKEKTSITWNCILQGLLTSCPQFCTSREEFVNIPRPLVSARWRETYDRKVLAPLALKQNTDNIIAGNVDMSRKRKSDVDIWAPSKYIKLDDSLKSCSVVIKRTSVQNLLLQYRCTNKISFVKLYDILKEIPQEKEEEKLVNQNEFMGFLGLESKQPVTIQELPDVKTSHPVKLISHPQIPFSSDYGRRLLTRERHCLPADVALRKIERVEWYLRGRPRIPKNNYSPEIVYDKKTKCTHTYKFPKKQFSQNHASLYDTFVRYVCKPSCVVLEKVDVAPYIAKMEALRNKVEKTSEIVEVLPNQAAASPIEKTVLESEGQTVLDTETCNVAKDTDIVSISDASLDVCVVSWEVPSVSVNESAVVEDSVTDSVPAKDNNHLRLKCSNNNNNSVNTKRSTKSCVHLGIQTKPKRISLRLNHNNTL